MSANLQEQIVTRPILFSGAMVRALLDGSKTQTRRIAKNRQPDGCNGYWPCMVSGVAKLIVDGNRCNDKPLRCPYGKVGDRLWVRETFCRSRNNTFYRCDGSNAKFKPNELSEEWDWDRGCGEKWTPSIHMHRHYSRITLEITGVRVERLNAIDECDAAAEGIKFDSSRLGHWEGWNTAKDAYVHLWESINGEGSWKQNPWVWVVEFKVV